MTDLANTLGLKAGMTTYFAHAPAEYFDLLGHRTYTHRPDEDGTYQFIHAFFTEKDQLEASLGILASKLANDGLLWISIPKNSNELSKESVEALAKQCSIKFSKETEFADWFGFQFVVA